MPTPLCRAASPHPPASRGAAHIVGQSSLHSDPSTHNDVSQRSQSLGSSPTTTSTEPAANTVELGAAAGASGSSTEVACARVAAAHRPNGRRRPSGRMSRPSMARVARVVVPARVGEVVGWRASRWSVGGHGDVRAWWVPRGPKYPRVLQIARESVTVMAVQLRSSTFSRPGWVGLVHHTFACR